MTIRVTHTKTQETETLAGISGVKVYMQPSLFVGGAPWARVTLQRRGQRVGDYDVENYNIEILNKGVTR